MNYTSKSISLPIDLLRLATGLSDSEKSKIADALQQLATLLRSMEEAKAVAWEYRHITDEGVSPIWTNCDIGTYMVLSEPHYRPTCEIRELFTYQPAESGEAKDAARYRWLRSNVRWHPLPEDASGVVYLVASMVSGAYGDCNSQTDAAIDAAMTAESREN